MVSASLSDDDREAQASLPVVLGVTFLGSLSGGSFWTGIFFITAGAYRFSAVRNLALGAAMGAACGLAAFAVGPLQRAAVRGMSSRALLAALFATWALAGFAVVARPDSEPTLWAAALVGAAASAGVWPLVESYLGSGRHGHRMHTAVGLFNVTWTPAVALPLFVLPLFPRDALGWALALSGAATALAIPLLWALPAHPAPHEPALAELDEVEELDEGRHGASGARAGDTRATARLAAYPFLLRASLWLLPLGSLMSANIAPVLPYRLAKLGSAGIPTSVVAATWMIARFTTLFVMWRLHGWRGRWSTLAAAAAALAAGLGAVLMAPALPLLVGGLVVFGVGMGLVYYAALYYSLSVGRGAVDAGGSFEGLSGLGYAVGPLLGLTGRLVARNQGLVPTDPASAAPGAAITVALVWLAAAVAFWFAARAFRRSRQVPAT